MGWPTDKGRIRLDKQQSVATARPAGSLWLVPLDLSSFFRSRIIHISHTIGHIPPPPNWIDPNDDGFVRLAVPPLERAPGRRFGRARASPGASRATAASGMPPVASGDARTVPPRRPGRITSVDTSV
jgi:hypothetical protein